MLCRLGLEGLVTFSKETHQYNPEDYSITIPRPSGDVTIAVFDKIAVDVGIEKDVNTQRAKVKMVMAAPVSSADL